MKKLIAGIIVLFLGFWMFTDPASLANTARQTAGLGWDGASMLFTKVIGFVKAV